MVVQNIQRRFTIGMIYHQVDGPILSYPFFDSLYDVHFFV